MPLSFFLSHSKGILPLFTTSSLFFPNVSAQFNTLCLLDCFAHESGLQKYEEGHTSLAELKSPFYVSESGHKTENMLNLRSL